MICLSLTIVAPGFAFSPHQAEIKVSILDYILNIHLGWLLGPEYQLCPYSALSHVVLNNSFICFFDLKLGFHYVVQVSFKLEQVCATIFG